MKAKKFLCLITSILGFACSIEASHTQLSEHHLLYKLIENQNYCVAAVDGNKIYLRSENIISKDGRLFIDLDGKEIALLPLIQFNGNGHFIKSDISGNINLTAARANQTKGPCPNCDHLTDKQGVCHNELCPFCDVQVL